MTDKSCFIVAIDGPCGSGKSTIGRLVARRLHFMYVDTGAMYRAVALSAAKRKIPLSDEETLGLVARDLDIFFDDTGDERRILLEGSDCTDALREETVSLLASQVSQVKAVREGLVMLQRRVVESAPGAVLDGRDVATVIFPNAAVKIYLTADEKVRTERRFEQLRSKNGKVAFETVLKELQYRDKQDSERTHSPLRRAAEAVLLDTTEMHIDDVVEKIAAIVAESRSA